MSRPRVPSSCEQPGCDGEAFGRFCPAHGADHGQASARHYQKRWRAGPRAAVLARDPICMVCREEPSTVADHHPTDRRDLVAMGVPDPDDPDYLRGVCRRCHNRKSGATWAR